MNIKMLKATIAGLVLSLSGFANAGLIEFIYTGTGSGSIGGVEFTDTLFTITEYSDTDNITSCSATCNTLTATSTTISLDGIDVFEFITGTRIFSSNGTVGLSLPSGGLDLFNFYNVGNYDLTGAFAPVTVESRLMQWDRSPIYTSGGLLEFDNQRDMLSTFEARTAQTPAPSDIPEPSTLAIFALAFITLIARRAKAK